MQSGLKWDMFSSNSLLWLNVIVKYVDTYNLTRGMKFLCDVLFLPCK
jgi:hypothetical protein